MTQSIQAPPVPNRDLAVSLLTGKFRSVVDDLPEHFAIMPEHELDELHKFTEIDYFLRKNLWKQVDLAAKGGISSITAASVYGGVCSAQNFEHALKNNIRVAWYLIRPTDTIETLESILAIGLKNLRAFVAKPPNEATAGPWLKAMEMLMNRVHGPVIHRIEAKHAHVNMNKPLPPPTNDAQKRIAELRTKLAQEKDVTPPQIPKAE